MATPRAPQVSIIVPTFNHANFLPETLECLREQSLADWECIVIDDGSTDDTREVVRRCSADDPRIKYYYQANRGLPAARNSGVARASGHYVQFLDADDLMTPDKLEAGVQVLDLDPNVGVCYCHYNPIDSATGALSEPWTHEMLGTDPFEDFLCRWEIDLCIPIHCGLFRRSLWSDPAVFREGLRAREDWLMWLDLAQRGVRFHFVDRGRALYRMHAGNMIGKPVKMTLSLLEVSLIIMSRIPEAYRERFVAASSRRMFRMLEMCLGAERVALEAQSHREGRE